MASVLYSQEECSYKPHNQAHQTSDKAITEIKIRMCYNDGTLLGGQKYNTKNNGFNWTRAWDKYVGYVREDFEKLSTNAQVEKV